MNLIFILAQAFGIIAWLLMVVSYYRKNTNKILFVQLLAIICYCLNYLFLGALTGIFVIIFELIRDYLYYKSDKDNLVFLFSIPFYLVLAYFAKDNLIELIPILASILEGFTFTRRKNAVVAGALVVYTLWIVYDLQVLSYTGAVTDAIIVLSNLFIIIKYFTILKKTDSFRIYSHHVLSGKIFDKIAELDRNAYSKDLLWGADYQKELYNKNKDTFSIIKYKNKIVGYINYLVLTTNEYNEIINNNIITVNYNNNDILRYHKNNDNYVIIDSIVIDEKYDNSKIIKLYNKAINKYINKKKKEGFKIGDIISIGVSDFEKRVLNNSILKNNKVLKDNNILYRYRDI